jgi:hypothetical protein
MMNWWKGFRDWLTAGPEYSVLKDWEPSNILYLPSAPQERAAWSDANLKLADAVVTVGLSSNTDGESDLSSDENNEPGEETMTTLEHADDLPSSTFRVFPSAANHRNSYDSAKSARGAVAQRKTWKGAWNRETREYGPAPAIKVYEAETVWRDVTEKYVKPDGQG